MLKLFNIYLRLLNYHLESSSVSRDFPLVSCKTKTTYMDAIIFPTIKMIIHARRSSCCKRIGNIFTNVNWKIYKKSTHIIKPYVRIFVGKFSIKHTAYKEFIPVDEINMMNVKLTVGIHEISDRSYPTWFKYKYNDKVPRPRAEPMNEMNKSSFRPNKSANFDENRQPSICATPIMIADMFGSILDAPDASAIKIA